MAPTSIGSQKSEKTEKDRAMIAIHANIFRYMNGFMVSVWLFDHAPEDDDDGRAKHGIADHLQPSSDRGRVGIDRYRARRRVVRTRSTGHGERGGWG